MPDQRKEPIVQKPEDLRHKPEQNAQIGVCSWSLQPSSPRDLLELLEQTDIRTVQLALVPLVEEPRIWAESIEILREHGVQVVSGMFQTAHEDYSTLETIRKTGGVCPDESWPETLKSAIRVADLAGEFQIRLVTLHAGFIPHDAEDPQHEIMLHRLRQIVDVFAQRGVSVGLETGQESAAIMLDALQALERPEVGINFDPANMILYGMGDPSEGLRLLSDHVIQVHVKDALSTKVPGTWGREVPAGSGDVDWDTFFAGVRALPRVVDLIIEREAGEARVADILTAGRLIADRCTGPSGSSQEES
jgi:sugar phosphate isomerase/epimerase